MKSSRLPCRSSAAATDQCTSYYAPAERKDEKELAHDLVRVAESPLINHVMAVAGGLFAVLNAERQVVALNDAFLKQIGVDDAGEAFGLRTGECLGCVHSREMPGGCGTSRYCEGCGAAIATLAALSTDKPQEKTCALTVQRDKEKAELYFKVRTYPATIDGEKYLLFFMQDVTDEQNRLSLDRTFFHDINNMLCGLIGKSLLVRSGEAGTKVKIEDIQQLIRRIAQEVAIHVNFQKSQQGAYQPVITQVTPAALLRDVELVFKDHTLCHRKELVVEYPDKDLEFGTDVHLVSRIITNMVTNALEATEDNGTVVLRTSTDGEVVMFSVWNSGHIEDHIARRIFQVNFSTKASMGRGLGTYSMKLFGEQILGGKVEFETATATGTTFTLRLPL